VVEWLVNAIGAGILGLIVGGAIVAVMHLLPGRTAKAHAES
jgi:predicted DNA repair protein MutK